jgi:4a-hydroxytetrahydrobiopterin dehydratase
MKLSSAEIESRLADLSEWAAEDGAFVRQFTLPSFADAITFVTRLAFEAEAADHHPDLLVSYRRVTVSWSTHSAGGITDKDVAGAEMTDAVAVRLCN